MPSHFRASSSSSSSSSPNLSLRAWLDSVDEQNRVQALSGAYGLDVHTHASTSATNAMRFLRTLKETSPSFLEKEQLFPSLSEEDFRGRPAFPRKALTPSRSNSSTSSMSVSSTSSTSASASTSTSFFPSTSSSSFVSHSPTNSFDSRPPSHQFTTNPRYYK